MQGHVRFVVSLALAAALGPVPALSPVPALAQGAIQAPAPQQTPPARAQAVPPQRPAAAPQQGPRAPQPGAVAQTGPQRPAGQGGVPPAAPQPVPAIPAPVQQPAVPPVASLPPQGGAAWRGSVSPVSIAVGLGAITGVAAFNAGALGLAAFPGGLAYTSGAVVPAEMAVAMNRLYAAASAVLGGWAGEYLYSSGGPQNDGTTGRLLATGAGAITGVAAFNLLSAPLGAVPLAGGAIDLMPKATVLGSRLVAVTSAGLGALGGVWLYGSETAQQVDIGYALSLFGGAVVGVAAGNFLTAGALGAPPYYVGAGLTQAGGVVASTAASSGSRIYAVGSAVAGALATDWWYRR